MKEMSIDLETYSDVNITKCGAYKYAESDEFEILLFGVSMDGGPVTVYDLACGDTIPEEILAALSDENLSLIHIWVVIFGDPERGPRDMPQSHPPRSSAAAP